MALSLLNYQETGAAACAARRRFGLFDEMGVGKTAQIIRALDINHQWKGIVVCPAVARENWRAEFNKFQLCARVHRKATSIHDFIAWKKGAFDVLVCSYEMMTKWAKDFADECMPIDFVVFDEAHYLKDSETKRAKALLGDDGMSGVLTWAQYAYWVTGTPVPNDPKDIYTFLRFTNAMPLKKQSFLNRYFDSQPGAYSTRHTAKISNLAELQSLISNNSIRRTLAETGIDLPPIFLTDTRVDGDTQAVRDLLLNHPGLDRAIQDALQNGGLSRLDTDHIATLRRLIGEAKAVPYAATLAYELANGLDKMVVFGVHRLTLLNVQNSLEQNGFKAVLINGDTPEAKRQEAMRAFQEDADCRVLLGNIRAAGTALTLTASCSIDMLESDWTPAGNAQALKRVHRISQTRAVRARFITLANSFDETVNEIVAQKTAAIAEITEKS